MKKLNKLFVILIAVLSVQTLSAQGWTASEVSAGTYYLYNVGANKFLCSGNNWGSHASVTEGGVPVTLTGSGNVYTISTAAIYSGKYLNGEWMDGGSYNWTFEKVSDKVYKLKNGSSVLYWNGGTSTNTTFGADPGTTASQWMLVTEDARVAALSNATQGSPIDATFLIKNAYFAKGNGRIVAAGADLASSPSWKGTTLTDLWGRDWGTEEACYAVEQYGKQFDNYQELTVPNGKYFMTAKGFYRGSTVPYIYANSEKCNLKVKGDIGGDNMTNGAIAMFGNDYLLDGVNVVVTNGNLRVGVKSDSWMEWCVFDDFKLIYYGKDLTLYENALSNAITTAQSIDKAKLNTAISNNLSKEITNSQAALNDANKTVESLEKQAALLNAIIETANNSIAPYATLRSLISLCTEYTSTQNSNANTSVILTTFKNAISTATTAGNTATDVDAINTAYNNLESARQTYAQNAVPVYPYGFDMTFLLANPNFDSNINGWTATNAGWMNAGNVECYNNTFTFALAEKLTGLGNGTWEVSVDGFYRYGGYNDAEAAHNGGTEELKAKLYANASEVGLRSIMDGANQAGNVGATTTGGARVPNSPAEGTIYFETGCYGNTVSTLVTDGTLTFGLKKESTKGNDWTLFDNFRLVYKGIDVSELQTNLTALIASANGIKSSKMGSTEKTNLTTALNAADASVTVADRLNEMLTALQNAYDAAVASIDIYSKVPAYIAMTRNIDASIADEYQNKYDKGTLVGDAEAIRQELNIKRFNAATEIFTNKVEVTGWTGDLANGVRNDQHWSGTTSNYYDANSWTSNFEGLTHSLSAELTLPKGTYVLKAAGRSSSDVTLSLNIKDGETTLESVQYTGKGDTGYGIDTNGNPNFSEEGVYANDDKGRGWEWEFVRFELTKETTVTLYVLCDYNSNQNRFGSFSDITLWMDDATYVTVNGHAIDEPLASAKALVDTKPMGTAENEALKAAIAQAEGIISTPAELDGAVEALNTAVNNAKAWGLKYTEAKAPLVAALERFEADYNLESTPDHAHMSNSAWTNVLENVQAAALAKDVTDSHEGFTTAASNLNAALDAAQASINMYANLAAEINYANAYTPLVAENKAAHTAAIAEAQAAYDAAEVDNVSEQIFAMQNYRALDYAYVTENYNKAVEIGEWTGQTNLGKEQHWNGDASATYFDYSKWSGGHINGDNEATLTIELPAGEYVLMAAGRAASVAGSAAYIKVNETKVYFPAKGDVGYGIDTDGKADFSEEGTYANGGAGRGWEYRFIPFILDAPAEVTLVAGMTIDVNAVNLSWAGVCAPVLLTPNLTEAQNQLQSAINSAIETRDNAYPVGEEVFQVSENSVAYKTLNEAITTAEDVLVKASTIKALTDEIHTLNAEVDNYLNGYVLNAPAEGQRFYIKVATEGHGKYGNAVLATLGNTGDNNPTGYGLNANNAVKTHLNQAFIFTQVEGNLYNISIERAEGTVYLTYGSLNGSAAGWNQWQIQATTDEANKGTFKIEATAKESILKIQNTITNEYLDCQDGGSIYTDTNIKNEEFAFELATESEVTLTLSKVGWATLILPFDAELPEGVQASSCGGVNKEKNELTLNKVKDGIIRANTPYLINGDEGTYDFSGYGMADKDSYTDGLFTGTYVNYQTTANSNTYVLQKKTIDGKDDVAFYLVGESGQPIVKPNRIYMTYADAAGAPRFSFGRGGETTSIDNSQFTIDNEVVIYDIMGRKVNTMEKGKMYIVNGKKVVIR